MIVTSLGLSVAAVNERLRGARRWTATRTDLVFGSNSQLRALSEVCPSADAGDKFVKAWTQAMDADRFALTLKEASGAAAA